jgi:hypothetical protein
MNEIDLVKMTKSILGITDMNNNQESMIRTDGLRGFGYYTPKDVLCFAKKALEYIQDDEEVKQAALAVVKAYDDKQVLKDPYRNLFGLIEANNHCEEMEICSDCGCIPELGACNYCKQD